jgi:rhamnose transport system ATP-binding protein
VSLLAASGLSKSFAGVRVLHGVDFDVAAGEVHALVGENGAGKSTLIKILGGAIRPDAGEVRLDGAPLPLGDSLQVRRAGVSVVYQEFTLVPDLSAAENVFLGRERGRLLLRRSEMQKAAAALFAELGVRIDAARPVRGLSVAQQQMVEIGRSLASDARIMILDEPTATLAAPEVERLFAAIRRLQHRGLGIVYISHRLDEIFALADRVTVLRDGRRVDSRPVAAIDRASLIRAMVGRDMAEEFPPRASVPGPTAIEVRGLRCAPRIHDVSFSVRAGEIVALAGLVGAGRTSSALTLIGAPPGKGEAGGEVHVGGRPVRFRSPVEALASGVAYVTEDRKAHGLFPQMSSEGNITIARLAAFTRAGVLSRKRERTAAAAAAREFDVRAAGLSQPAGTLSGGNQQKVLLARYLLVPPTVLILDEPTRGVDVGARAEIYRQMNRLSERGLAILMISSDLNEVLGMADRIVVMRGGRTTGELDRRTATAEAVMTLAATA